ncbi:MAG: DUF362 domain-containing protein [Verrucomicrobiales bacterium]|nr:DUF362 domain-containing protein [Verrucomicrobiales bacterium]
MKAPSINRRSFLNTSLFAGLGLAMRPWQANARPAMGAVGERTRVALTTGTDRANMAFEGMKPFADAIRRAIAGKRVVIKPNNVAIDTPLCATHAESIEGILEFLKSIGRTDNIVIAESAAGGPTLDGFANYGYNPVAGKFGAKLVDLDQEAYEKIHVFDEKDFRPHPVRTSSLLLSRDNFIISATRLKTHDRAVATLSLKNIVFGAPIKDLGFAWGRNRKPGTTIDKPIVHGSGFRGINYNLYALSRQLRPDLSVLDGVEGMEGNGPVGGTPVDHRVGVVSLDWLAADRVGVELMGIDFAKMGYLNFCADAGMGCADLARMEILGPEIRDHVKPYRLHRNIEEQLIWMRPA